MNLDLKYVLWMLLIGATVAGIAVLVMRASLGKFVRKLLDAGADSPENAKSLSDLQIRESGSLRTALKGKGPLGAVVRSTGEDVPRYYIPEDQSQLARSKFRKEKLSLPLVLLCLLLLALAAVGAAFLWPGLSGLWSKLIPTSC